MTVSIVTIVEFKIIGIKLGYRIMGMFDNSQLNAFVLLMSIVLLLYINYYNSLNKIVFRIFFIFFSVALILTGTRGEILALLIIIMINFFYNLSLKISSKRNFLFLFTLFLMIVLIIFPFLLNFVNSLSGRGSLLLQQLNGGRLSKLENIVFSLYNDDIFVFLFGKGVGWGSNIVSSLFKDFVGVYGIVDGTLQYLIVRFGVFGGIFMFFYLIYILYKNFFKNYKKFIYFMDFLIAVFFISISVNILEIKSVLLIMGVIIGYVIKKERKYYKIVY